MRRLPVIALSLLAVAAFAACSSAGQAGWTYAPAPSATPVPSGSAPASGEPPASAPASAPASVAPSGTPGGSTGPSGQPSGTVVTVSAPTGAATTGFDPKDLTGPANTPFKLEFDNQDATAPHNIVISDPSGQPVNIGDTAFFTGPEKRTYDVPALAPGAYPFMCQVHPTTMTGTLTIQ
jgi:plastocyanin